MAHDYAPIWGEPELTIQALGNSKNYLLREAISQIMSSLRLRTARLQVRLRYLVSGNSTVVSYDRVRGHRASPEYCLPEILESLWAQQRALNRWGGWHADNYGNDGQR
jgi:hypothetical protein